jgi:hypothetical protein
LEVFWTSGLKIVGEKARDVDETPFMNAALKAKNESLCAR